MTDKDHLTSYLRPIIEEQGGRLVPMTSEELQSLQYDSAQFDGLFVLVYATMDNPVKNLNTKSVEIGLALSGLFSTGAEEFELLRIMRMIRRIQRELKLLVVPEWEGFYVDPIQIDSNGNLLIATIPITVRFVDIAEEE